MEAVEEADATESPMVPLEELEAKLRTHLATTDVSSTTLKEIRKQVSRHQNCSESSNNEHYSHALHLIILEDGQ